LSPLGEFLQGVGLPTQDLVFVPAGMFRTHLVEQVGEVVPGLATGYFRRDGAWMRAPHAFPLHGEGGLVGGSGACFTAACRSDAPRLIWNFQHNA